MVFTHDGIVLILSNVAAVLTYIFVSVALPMQIYDSWKNKYSIAKLMATLMLFTNTSWFSHGYYDSRWEIAGPNLVSLPCLIVICLQCFKYEPKKRFSLPFGMSPGLLTICGGAWVLTVLAFAFQQDYVNAYGLLALNLTFALHIFGLPSQIQQTANGEEPPSIVLTLLLFLVCLSWAIYGAVKPNLYMCLPNILGTLGSAIMLHQRFRRKKRDRIVATNVG